MSAVLHDDALRKDIGQLLALHDDSAVRAAHPSLYLHAAGGVNRDDLDRLWVRHHTRIEEEQEHVASLAGQPRVCMSSVAASLPVIGT